MLSFNRGMDAARLDYVNVWQNITVSIVTYIILSIWAQCMISNFL